jgi:Na+-translocating ferredoxin:NAD+ oxidoreductase RnfD subunit
LPTTVNPNSELISFDVVSLYTNIPHDLGISAITFWLENKRNIVQDRLSKEFILETMKIILERNVFYFDGKFYRQKRGTQWEWCQLTLLLFLDTLNIFYTNNF